MLCPAADPSPGCGVWRMSNRSALAHQETAPEDPSLFTENLFGSLVLVYHLHIFFSSIHSRNLKLKRSYLFPLSLQHEEHKLKWRALKTDLNCFMHLAKIHAQSQWYSNNPKSISPTHICTHTHTHTHWWTEITLTCFVNFHYPAAVGRAQSVWTFHWPTGHWSVSSTPALCCDCSVNLPSASSHLSLTWTQYTNTIQNSACWLLRRSASNFFMSVFNMNTTNSVFLTTLQSCLQLLHVCLTWTPYINTILCADCSADLPLSSACPSDLTQ